MSDTAIANVGPVDSLSTSGRAVFGLNAVVVAVGIVVQLFATADPNELAFFDGSARVLNVLCFFTIQSNIVLGLTCALLAIGAPTGSLLFRVLRMIGVVGIALTFVVFHFALSGLHDLTGEAAFADVMLHTVSPVLGVGGWLLFGPRRLTSTVVVWWTTAYVAAWGLVTMIRGAIVERDGVHFYPYPFMDPTDKGYLRVALNLVVVAAVFFGLAFAAHALDGWLDRRRDADRQTLDPSTSRGSDVSSTAASPDPL